MKRTNQMSNVLFWRPISLCVSEPHHEIAPKQTKKITSMKIKSASRPAFFNLRVLIGFGLCAVGLLPASAQIGGGGTADYIPLWLDSSTLGDSSIHQSPSGYIGIGTQLPIAALGVVNVHGARAIHGSTRGNFTAVEGLNLSSTGANAVGVAG